jgi:hypothetical protein
MKNAFILDCQKEVKQFLAETIDIDLPSIATECIVEMLIDVLNDEGLDKRDIHAVATMYIQTDDMYIQYEPDALTRLYSSMLKLAGAIRNKLRHHHAYVDGQFPFTFTKSIHHGTFYLTRKREAASPIAHHPRHAGGGV